MTAGFLIKGILIGLLFGIPVGVVGTLTVQRDYRHGFAAGLKTGLGSFVADCLYAACGAFGLSLIVDAFSRRGIFKEKGHAWQLPVHKSDI